MRKSILRNIAIVSAIGMITFSIMLITNYFQVRGFNPLQTEVIETLKQINDENANNIELQEQIRQLDLLARSAYFVNLDRLKSGVYILIGMLVVFVLTLRFYFAEYKQLPGKQVDPVDDWLIKTNARKYIGWATGGLVAAALLFVFLSSPHLSSSAPDNEKPEMIAEVESSSDEAQLNESLGESLDDSTVSSESLDSLESLSSLNSSDLSSVAVTSNAFRGNNSNAVSPARSIPVKWDLASGENIAWKSDVPKHGFNSPVITGNKVFITGADDQARELYCYDLSTGKRLWTLVASNIPGSPVQMPKTTNDTGLAASTVATNGQQVCAIFATGDIICADMNGKRLWAKNLGVPQNHYGYASSLLAFGNTVIVQYDNSNTPRILAFDMATGAERWAKTRTDKITWSSPIIAYINNQPQLVLMGNPGITGYNPNNGEQLWRVDGMSGEVGASPCSAAGRVFGASEYAALIAIDATTGKQLWKADDYLPEVSSPVATKDNVYLATSYGVLACYDAETGELKHSHELNTEFYSSPVITEGKLYLFSNDGRMFIYSTNEDFQLLHSFETGQRTFATPAFTDGKIVVRTESSLYCVSGKKIIKPY